MANKNSKAAKAKLAIDVKAQKPKLGKAFYYIGCAKGVMTTCPTCRTPKSKGIVYEYEKEFYCSDGCIERVKRNA